MAGISSRDGFGGSSLQVTITTTFWGGGRYSEVVRKSSRTECLAGPSGEQPELIETIVVSREQWAEIRLRLGVSGSILRRALGTPGPQHVRPTIWQLLT